MRPRNQGARSVALAFFHPFLDDLIFRGEIGEVFWILTERRKKKAKGGVVIFYMVYSTHPYFSLHFPQITPKVNTLSHLALFEALLSAIFFGEEDRGRRGERRICLSAARGREDTSTRGARRRATKIHPSEVSHLLTLAWQRDQGQTLATWLPKHGHCRPSPRVFPWGWPVFRDFSRNFVPFSKIFFRDI